MTNTAIPTDAAARLDELARLLAAAILRARHHHILKAIPARGTRENCLELCASSRSHVQRNGERP